MRLTDRIGGVLLLALALYITWEARAWDYTTDGIPGPGFAPFWVGLLVAVAAVAVLVRSWRRPLGGLLGRRREVRGEEHVFEGPGAKERAAPPLGLQEGHPKQQDGRRGVLHHAGRRSSQEGLGQRPVPVGAEHDEVLASQRLQGCGDLEPFPVAEVGDHDDERAPALAR